MAEAGSVLIRRGALRLARDAGERIQGPRGERPAQGADREEERTRGDGQGQRERPESAPTRLGGNGRDQPPAPVERQACFPPCASLETVAARRGEDRPTVAGEA